jgi:hypothetical protein
MAKKKQPINCSTCFYAKRDVIKIKGKCVSWEEDKSKCRRYPEHKYIRLEHWCGEYLDEKTGIDLVQRED